MRVKHLYDLYTWGQIRKVQGIYEFNHHNGFVPIAICAPGGGCESRYGGKDEHYGWYGKQSPYYAKRLWEAVRIELADMEKAAFALDIVEASECFNTIRFVDPRKVKGYVAEFRAFLKKFSDERRVMCAIGRAPSRAYPWDKRKRYEEVIIADDAEYRPGWGHDPGFDDTIPDYCETAPLEWRDIERFFVELTEDELAFLNGWKYINKSPSELDTKLHEACRVLDEKRVKLLLEEGANPNSNSGGAFSETLLSGVMESYYDLAASDCRAKDAFGIADLLVSHGYDLDFAPYESCTPMYDAVRCGTEWLEYLLKKGADANAISWIGIHDSPATPLDSVHDDIGANGECPDLLEMFDLIDKAGGKYFCEIVPDYNK